MLEDVLKTVDRNQRFVLTSHARPDGDAIGSVLACGEVLRQLGKTADVVLSDGVPVIYKPLPFADDVIHARAVSGKYEAAVILECDSIQRTRLADRDLSLHRRPHRYRVVQLCGNESEHLCACGGAGAGRR